MSWSFFVWFSINPVRFGLMDISQFNAEFLLATREYHPKVALSLIRQCRDDIHLWGSEYAKDKWGRFVYNHNPRLGRAKDNI